jgi:hypothetical protein
MQRYRHLAFSCDDGGMNSQLHLDFPQFRMDPLRASDTPDSLIFLASDRK